MIYRLHIKDHERGLRFVRGNFTGMLAPGWHARYWPELASEVTLVSALDLALEHPLLTLMAPKLANHPDLRLVQVKDGERALIWRDGRFAGFRGPGAYAFWTVSRELRVEVVAMAGPRLEHAALAQMLQWPGAQAFLETIQVPPGHAGLLLEGGRLVEQLGPGRYAWWRGGLPVEVKLVDLREQLLDIAGQEILSADKVSLRLNAVLTWQVREARQMFETVGDPAKALYRDAQLALRTLLGALELDALLAGCADLLDKLTAELRQRAEGYGVRIISLGLRDLILPGEMRELLNQVTGAKKAAEAAFITRREEVATMRAQANSARLLAENPTLMRLRELEVLEKVADKAKLTVILGEKGLADRVTNLL